MTDALTKLRKWFSARGRLTRVVVASFFLLLVTPFLLRLVPAPDLHWPEADSQVLFDRNGKLLTLSLSSDEKYRFWLPLEKISPALIESTLQYEDRHFYSHPGVNPYSLARGAWTTFSSGGARMVGGSTLTMQVVRLRLGLKTRSILGKLQQIFWALVFEEHYSKEQILEAYLYLAPYGSNIEGVGAASLIYYRHAAEEISEREAVTLAVLPQHPSLRWRMDGRKNLDQARSRLVSFLEQRNGTKIIPRNFFFSPADVPNEARHFLDRAKRIRPGETVYHSTIDSGFQREMEEVLAEILARYAEFGVSNGMILLAEIPNMKVRAYVGSAGYTNASISGFVNGLVADRSPGSLLKPFVYGLALDQGKIIPQSMLSDLPLRLASYRPENFERNFIGPISAEHALIRSRNIPALEVFRMLNRSSFYQFLGAADLTLKPEEYYGIALVLGGLGISTEQIAQLYGVLGNGGKFERLSYFEDEKQKPDEHQLLSPETAFLVRDMMSHNPPALGRFRGRKIPWKTGTSHGSKDAWAAGLVGRYVLVVWLGDFYGASNPNLVGRDYAGPLFFSAVHRLLGRGVIPETSMDLGLNVKRVKVCALSGAFPRPACQHRKESWFIPGVSPIGKCTVHQMIKINPASGERTCPGEPGQDQVYEVWSSEMQKLFKRVGLKRNTPPPFKKACGVALSAPQRVNIISPEEHLEYYLEEHRPLEIQLLATVPGDAEFTTWFVDDVVVAHQAAAEPVHWTARAGKFTVRVVDNLGRSASVRLKVHSRAG